MELVSRRTERGWIEERLAAGESALIAGAPGIGKTALWEAGTATALAGGRRVVRAVPTAAEQSFAYAVLGDLLEQLGLDGHALPSVQRRALERVLLVADDGGPVDPRLVGIALRSLLECHAPVVVAVDDVQWVDPASASVLAFALRRAGGACLLAAIRTGADSPLAAGAARIELGPLTAGAIHHLLADRLDVRLPRTKLLRIHAVSGGNPLYALELARVNRAGDELVVPPSLVDAIAARLAGFGHDTHRALAWLALAGFPPPDGDLSDAIAAGLLEHPLFGEVAVSMLPESEARRLHREIASRSEGERRVHHLARAVEGEDEPLAAELATAAGEAGRRGALASAAELWERAAQLTPQVEAAVAAERSVEAGLAHMLAGNPDRGAELLRGSVDRVTNPSLRSRGLAHLALMRARDDSRAVIPLLAEALREADDDRTRHEIVHLLAAFFALVGDRRRAAAVARRHLRSAERLGGAVLREALLLAAGHELALDRPVWHLVERAAALEEGSAPPSWRTRRLLVAVHLRDGCFDEARAALEAAQADGNVYDEGGFLAALASVELAEGDARAAEATYDEILGVGEQIQAPYLICDGLIGLATAEAVLGRVDQARAHAARAQALAERVHAGEPVLYAQLALGLLELSLGELDAAAERYLRIPRREWTCWNPLAGGRAAVDAVEALATSGHGKAAREIAESIAVGARERSVAEICLAALDGDPLGAATALQALEPNPSPFRRAREVLLAGRLLRQARRRTDARSALDSAHRLFDELGANCWREQTERELGRLGGRSPHGAALTESERRVAELVASGLGNKEVAARLVVTVRTVEAHLTSVYAKVGVRSRAALAARWPTL